MPKSVARPPLDAAARAHCERELVRLMPMIKRIAVSSRLPFPMDDLVQEGAKAVVESLHRFDAGRGLQLETWIYWRVMGAMRDYARNCRFLQGGRRARTGQRENVQSIYLTLSDDDTGKTVRLVDVLHASPAEPNCDWPGLLRGFSKRERIILISYFVLDRTMKQIAEDLGIGESRVSQLMTQLLNRLRDLEASEHRVSECVL
jgi:RNA polymerase sigma factor (sigma-70 family)